MHAYKPNIDNKTPSSISSPPYAFRQGLSLNLTVISTRLVDPDFLPWYWGDRHTPSHTWLSCGCCWLEMTFSLLLSTLPTDATPQPKKDKVFKFNIKPHNSETNVLAFCYFACSPSPYPLNTYYIYEILHIFRFRVALNLFY